MRQRLLELTRNSISTFVRLTAKLAMVAVLCALLLQSRTPTLLESIIASGELHIASRNGPTTYYEGAQGPTGFEYTMAKQFADSLGVQLVVHESTKLGQMLDEVSKQQYHFAAAGLTVTPIRAAKVRFGPSYQEVAEQVIYRQGFPRPRAIEDLIGKRIRVIANSAHTEKLHALKNIHPELTWEAVNDVDMIDLLEAVHNGDTDFAIVDSNAYTMNAALYPEAQVAFDIGESQQLAWAFPITKDKSLYTKATHFFNEANHSGYISKTQDSFYGHTGELNYADSIIFLDRVINRLPKWRDTIEVAANQNELDWKMIAAIGYQESHWNPKAVSYTGVKGFMMLTRPTAKEMGVQNRLDPQQSITGGTKYFKKILGRIPSSTKEPDRTWQALAAYNMGYGHLRDARALTMHQGGNPDRWDDVKERVLLLEKSSYYKYLPHGYARGREAFQYVQNIRNFHSIIAWNEAQADTIANLLSEEINKPEVTPTAIKPQLANAINELVSDPLTRF